MLASSLMILFAYSIWIVRMVLSDNQALDKSLICLASRVEKSARQILYERCDWIRCRFVMSILKITT